MPERVKLRIFTATDCGLGDYVHAPDARFGCGRQQSVNGTDTADQDLNEGGLMWQKKRLDVKGLMGVPGEAPGGV